MGGGKMTVVPGLVRRLGELRFGVLLLPQTQMRTRGILFGLNLIAFKCLFFMFFKFQLILGTITGAASE